jgi:hypothetical protein
MSKANMRKHRLKPSPALSVRHEAEPYADARRHPPKFITVAIDQYSGAICGLLLPTN